jgi:hypothetical protein
MAAFEGQHTSCTRLDERTLKVGLAVGDERLDELQHLGGGLGDLDKDAVVDLEQAEELEDLAGLGRHVVDTAEADDKVDLGLVRDVVLALGLGQAAEADLLSLLVAGLVDVELGALEQGLPRCLASLYAGQAISISSLTVKIEKMVSDPAHALV